MVPVTFHEDAEDDLAEIEAFQCEYMGANAAAIYLDELIEFCEDIGVYPNAGRSQRVAGAELQVRTFRKRYQVVYRYSEGVVTVLEVHHSSMSDVEIRLRLEDRL